MADPAAAARSAVSQQACATCRGQGQLHPWPSVFLVHDQPRVDPELFGKVAVDGGQASGHRTTMASSPRTSVFTIGL